MKVTIKDIAKAAGVSHPTVSKALNGAPGVSEEIRKKIEKIAKQMNYVPNLAAKRLADRRTNSIGLIWPRLEGLFFYHLGLRLQKEAAGLGLDVILSLDDPPRALRAFHKHFVDQIVFWCAPNWTPSLEFMRQKELFHGQMLLMGGGRLEGTHRIGIDRKGAIYEAVRHLADYGHRKITFIGDSSEKLAGFTQGVLEQKLEYHSDYRIETKEGEPFPETRVAELLAKKDRPTAFIVDSQTYAFALIKLFKERNIRIPDDYSLIVYDDIPEMEGMDIPLTTVGPSVRQLAAEALAIVSGTGGWSGSLLADLEVGCELNVRRSTRRIETV
ncbi:LacI family DNA-binding transcriptional regulator [Paenibacillus sp. MBLB4367]|uniref:LacI family DNA-binding transcriptional regulator n=1 Tax=Paenibacillus sp. MBLB4367 TaxID=3384767 RepID=UPI003908184A